MTQPTHVTIPQALQLAQRAIAAGQLQQGEIILRQILAANPNQPQALHMLGHLALQASRPEIAVEMLIAAVKAPEHQNSVHLDLGNAYLMLGRLPDAADAYRRFLSTEPNHSGTWSNLGITLHEAGDLHGALQAFQKALELAPNVPDRHNNLGTALMSLGKLDDAVSSYERATQLDPNHAPTRHNFANALKEVGEVERAVDVAREMVRQSPGSAQAHSNLLLYLQYDTRVSAEEIFQEHRKWNDAHAKPLATRILPHGNDRSPQRRLRVGYVSPDLREHSVPFFFEGLLEKHDPAQVETFCYADMLRKQDQVSDRLQGYAHHWKKITGLGDEQVAEIIRRDQIDILVDLAGHTAGGRLLVFARKPAPVQVSYLGYPSTTGVDAIDYYLTDEFLDPAGISEHLFSEQLIRLPKTFAAYKPPEDAPAIAPPPAMANEYVTFASFNTFAKVNSKVIETWASILSQIGNARLLICAKGMNTPAMADRVRAKFALLGIDPQRLEFGGYVSRQDYFQTHQRADILLDTFPVNGHTITCHALWMGVPVISLLGDRHCGRLGSTVLNNLGLTELLARSVDQYVQIATDLASDLAKLQALRATLRERMIRSSILDASALARHVEGAYRTIWNKLCDGLRGSNS